jgi:RecA/RadA recombinase
MAKRKQEQSALDFGFEQRNDWNTKLLSTGMVPIDYALGGGFGYGRASEVYGNYSSGKTYVMYLALIQNQRMGGVSILFEEEGAFHPGFFSALGGNPDTLQIPDEADTVEKVFDTLKEKIFPIATKNPNVPIAVGWDSIACTATNHLEEVGMEKKDMSKAEAMSRGCSLIRDDLRKSGVALIASNQTRTKIGMFPTTVTPGGSGYPFLCSTRVELTFDGGNSKSWITRASEGENVAKVPIGRWIRLRIEKNKLGPAMRGCSLPFYTEVGQQHPVYGYTTSIGIDHVEALWNFYCEEGFFKLPPLDPDAKPWEGPKVIETLPKGWYCINERIDPTKKNFRAADWPEKLEQFPMLKTLPMESCQV